MSRIQSDLNRFRQIVRGRVREELRRHLGHQEMIGKHGGRMVSIPVPHLELPASHMIRAARVSDRVRAKEMVRATAPARIPAGTY